jgi:Flp pilus assembly protein TadG
MQVRSRRSIRRGASLVEAAIILPIFLTLALGTIDVGLAVFQNHAIAEASRQGARIASVHGSLAPSGWNGGPWGTTAYSGAGNSTDTIPSTMSAAGAFAGLNPANVTVSVSWPDNGNNGQNGDRVQVQVSSTWTPIYTYLFGGLSVKLQATSIMPIAH